jgi:hypothetical protein
MLLLCLLTATGLQIAQAVLRITVTDPSGGVLVGAHVQIADGDRIVAAAVTDGRGEALFEHVLPGRYVLRVEAPGFEAQALSDVRLRAGQNRRTVQLSIARFTQAITVNRDPRLRASDPRGDAFATRLGPDQIDQLPDDPDEMARVLLDMAGPGAALRVNGFRSTRLPPKDQIQHVRFRRNAFAADTHEPGGVFVDIVTRPGSERWRGLAAVGVRASALGARNALAVRETHSSLQRYSLSSSGPLWRQHTSLAFAVDATSSVEARPILAILPDGPVADVTTRPFRSHVVTGRLEHALPRAHVLRAELDHASGRLDRAGVGDFNLLERGYRQRTSGQSLRLSTSGALGRAAWHELRLQLRDDAISYLPDSAAPAVIVLNAFSRGGAQIAGTRSARQFELADDIDVARGHHAWRAGFLLEGVDVTTDVSRNAAGTFTFASLDAFRLGRATTYVRNIGDPRATVTLTQWGAYLQNDFRVRRDLTLSAGVRQEFQSVVGAWQWGPRASVAWSPFASGRTTVRAGAGVFFDWFDAQSVEYVRQLDGAHQQLRVIVDAPFPLTDDVDAIALPPGRAQLASDLEQPRIVQGSVGVEQQVAADVRVNATWTLRRGRRGLRGLNVNGGVGGRRPDPDSGPIVEIASSARSAMDGLTLQSTYNPAGKALFISASYAWSRSMNEADGPTSLPADAGDLAAEWGPSLDDVGHRFTALFSTPVARRVRLGMSMRLQSGSPYDITTGSDDNRDTISNDRPPGVTRNAARGAAQVDVSVRLGWTIGFGRRAATGAGATALARSKGDGDALAAFGSAVDPTKRYHVELYAQAFNLLNHVNVTTYSGVLTSPIFGQPIAVAPARRVELGARLRF